MTNSEATRIPEANVDRIFLERWSPRALSADQTISEADVCSLFEAARWSPSSYNKQPWRFIYETTGGECWNDILEVLAEPNRAWAHRAALITIVMAELDPENPDRVATSTFDVGAATLSLTLQARIMGFYTHAMGGIIPDNAYSLFNIPRDEYKVLCAVAVGRKDDPGILPEELRQREAPSARKPLSQVMWRGRL